MGVIVPQVAAIPLEDLLSNIGAFFVKATGWLGQVLDVVTANPPLLVMVIAMPVCGFAVGLLSRLIRL